MIHRKKNIVVTGAKGQLGSYLVDLFRKKSLLKKSIVGQVYGIDMDVDITSRSELEKFFTRPANDPMIDIDYVIHCAASTNTSAIEKDPIEHYNVNCLGTKNVAEVCAKNGIKMILISTDYVLSEKSSWCHDRWQEYPVNQYGMQKLVAELFAKEAFKDQLDDLLVLRSSWMFGNSSTSFVEKFLTSAFNAYAKAQDNFAVPIEVPVVDDAYGRPTPVWFIADSIENFIAEGMHGTYDLQYPCRQISRYEWAVAIWDAFVNPKHSTSMVLVDQLKDKIKIVPCKSKDLGIGMRHPGKVGDDDIELDNGLDACWLVDTQQYVDKNWLKYANLAKEIIVDKA